MPRNRSETVSEGNGLVPHHNQIGPDQPTLADVYRLFEEIIDRQLNLMKSHFDQLDKKMDGLMETTRGTNQRLVGLLHGAQQRRFAIEANVKPDTKTCKRTKDAAADREKHGNKSSSAQVDHDPICLTSFGDDSSAPLTLPCRDDALADKGAKAQKPCLSPVKMHTLIAAGGLLTAGTAFTALRTIFSPPFFSWSLGEETEKNTSRTNFNHLATHCWRKVIQTKLRQTLVFNPGGSTVRLHACPFLGGCARCSVGKFYLDAAMVSEAGAFLVDGGEVQAIHYAVRIAVDCCFPEARLARGSRQSLMARG